MLFPKDKVLEGLAACSEFCCGECPYQKYEDRHEYIFRCIHLLIKDLNELRKEYIDENVN